MTKPLGLAAFAILEGTNGIVHVRVKPVEMILSVGLGYVRTNL
jgi:hypothetical protein